MTNKTGNTDMPKAEDQPAAPPAQTVEPGDLGDDQLDGVSGGLSPQTHFS
jgi:hypothetical protein